MRILKFGGKSLSTPEKMQNICKYIKKIYKNEKKLIIVVSAIGSTTDNLLKLANSYGKEYVNERELDALLSTGETQSSCLMAIMLSSIGVPAKSFQGFQIELTTFGAFQNSKIAYINKNKIINAFENNQVVVVAGFQGINKNGDISTLGRGGSDTTATALGAVFDENVEIYSDFDGVFAGDPRIYKYKKLKKVNYNTMMAMANTGAKVLDVTATEIAKKFGIDITLKSANDFARKGTLISNVEEDVVAISQLDNLCKISISFSNISKLKNISKNVISTINNINFYNFELKNNQISFYIPSEQKAKVIQELSEKLKILDTKKRTPSYF